MTEQSGNIQNIRPVEFPKVAGTQPVTLHDEKVPSFADTFKKFIKDVNAMQNHADRSIEKMVAGEITDVHQVMVAVEEANTAFNMMMEIRNKMLDAYQELMRMQI